MKEILIFLAQVLFVVYVIILIYHFALGIKMYKNKKREGKLSSEEVKESYKKLISRFKIYNFLLVIALFFFLIGAMFF